MGTIEGEVQEPGNSLPLKGPHQMLSPLPPGPSVSRLSTRKVSSEIEEIRENGGLSPAENSDNDISSEILRIEDEAANTESDNTNRGALARIVRTIQV